MCKHQAGGIIVQKSDISNILNVKIYLRMHTFRRHLLRSVRHVAEYYQQKDRSPPYD